MRDLWAGHYQFLGRDQASASRFGLKPIDQVVHYIFECDRCGHSEIYRWDNLTLMPLAWKEKER